MRGVCPLARETQAEGSVILLVGEPQGQWLVSWRESDRPGAPWKPSWEPRESVGEEN
jgi:hypothetical protein